MYECIVCGKEVKDYIPEYFCSGKDCECMGMPTEPPLCNKECSEKIYGADTDKSKNS